MVASDVMHLGIASGAFGFLSGNMSGVLIAGINTLTRLSAAMNVATTAQIASIPPVIMKVALLAAASFSVSATIGALLGWAHHEREAALATFSYVGMLRKMEPLAKGQQKEILKRQRKMAAHRAALRGEWLTDPEVLHEVLTKD